MGRGVVDISFAVNMFGKNGENPGMDGCKADRRRMFKSEDCGIWIRSFNFLNCTEPPVGDRVTFFGYFEGEGDIWLK